MLVLEFSHPHTFPARQLYSLYSRYVIPRFGRQISGNENAYSYLPESVAAFPSGSGFLEIMKSVGLKNTGQRSMTFGIASIYRAEK